MCTIGAVKNFKTGHSYFFKNLDQPSEHHYTEPFFCEGDRYRYLKLPTGLDRKRPGVWAGVNAAGVTVLGADGNCMPNFCGSGYGSLNDSLLVYEQVLGSCKNVHEAVAMVMRKYQERRMGGNGDIVIVGDADEAVALEYSPDRWGIQYRGPSAYLVRTNFFVLLNSLRPAPEENTLHSSSALRYASTLGALSVGGNENSLDDIFRTVRDHRNGPNAMSVCRHGGEGEYFSHACFVAEITGDAVNAYVMINNHPCTGEFKTYTF